MNPLREPTLKQVRWCVLRDDRGEALRLLLAAIETSTLLPRDGIELILTLRQATQAVALEAIDRVITSPAGTYRYVPQAENGFF